MNRKVRMCDMHRGTLLCAGLLAAALAAGQGPTGTASIAGTVVDSAGKPVTGVRIMVTRVSLKPGEPNPGVFLATTAADGTYTVRNLPGADYNICASDDANRYLNPCTWSGPLPITVSEGGQQTGIQVQVQEAAEVDVDLTDAAGLLSKHGANPPAHRITIGVPAPYIFLPATTAPDSTGVKHFKVFVPFDRDVQVYLRSPSLKLADAKGNAFANGWGNVPVKVPRGQPRATVSATVAGVDTGAPAAP